MCYYYYFILDLKPPKILGQNFIGNFTILSLEPLCQFSCEWKPV